jgi:DNA primase (bacterial type)
MHRIEEIKKALPVERVLARYVTLRRTGRTLQARCPFHDDRTPSFTVYPESSRATCFGCGWQGDIVDFVQKITGCTTSEALQTLEEMRGVRSAGWQRAAETFTEPLEVEKRQQLTLPQWKPLADALWQTEGEPGRTYLQGRGLKEEILRRSQIGFIRNGEKMVAPAPGDANFEEQQRILALRTTPWVGFPYIVGERVVLVKWRATAELPLGTERYRSTPGMSTELPFNFETVDTLDDIYVTEGEIDTLTLEQAGFRAISLKSASHRLPATARDRLIGAGRIFLAGDNERRGTGRLAMERLIKDLGAKAHLLLWPLGEAEEKKDANGFFLENCHGEMEKFREALVQLSIEAARPSAPHFLNILQLMKNLQAKGKLLETNNRLMLPWPSLNKSVLIEPGDIVAVQSSVTGTGKSAFVTQVCLHNAIEYGKAVAIYTPDLKPNRHTRMVVAQLGQSSRTDLGPTDFFMAREQLKNARFYLGFDPGARGAGAVLDLCEQAVKRLGLNILVIDTLHFIVREMPERTRAFEDAMARLNSMAEAYGLIVIIVVQNRKGPSETRSRERWVGLEDVKDSEAITSDSAAVILLHRKPLDLPKKNERYNVDNPQLESLTLVRFSKGREQLEQRQAGYLQYLGDRALFEEHTGAEPPPEASDEPF